MTDTEPNGQVHPTAHWDDVDGDDDDDDEDGITSIPNILEPGRVATVRAEVSVAVYLSGWIDYSDDGDWDDANEHIVTDYLVTAGHTYTLTGSVPPNSQPGPGYARFRISSLAGVGYSGPAADGEVEDYYVPGGQPGVLLSVNAYFK